MVREQKEILNETSDIRETENKGEGADIRRTASEMTPAAERPQTRSAEPAGVIAQEKSAIDPAQAQQKPAVSEQTRKEWSLEQLKKDIVSE
jgi:hypothetical protein